MIEVALQIGNPYGKPITDQELIRDINKQINEYVIQHNIRINVHALSDTAIKMARYVLQPSNPIEPYLPYSTQQLKALDGENIQISIVPYNFLHSCHCCASH